MMDRKPMTDQELMELLPENIKTNVKVYICDMCGAWATDMLVLIHKPDCPDAGVKHGN